jgi:hypothetical protein
MLDRIQESTSLARREIGEVSAANEDYETRAPYEFSDNLEKVIIDEDVRNLQNDGFVKGSRYKARKTEDCGAITRCTAATKLRRNPAPSGTAA